MTSDSGDSESDVRPAPGGWRLMAMQIAWPAFLMASVLEALVFSVVDPASLHWFGRQPIDWPAQAVYTVSFFIFWLVVATACGISRALHTFGQDVRVGP